MRDILERPSRRRRDEFLAAVARSRKLHGHWATPPRTVEAFEAYLKRLKQSAHMGHWVRTEANELAGVININEIVRGTFCSGYLGYDAEPHNFTRDSRLVGVLDGGQPPVYALALCTGAERMTR